jgi:hypothetical protein
MYIQIAQNSVSKNMNKIHSLFSKLSDNEQKDLLAILSRHNTLSFPKRDIIMVWNEFYTKNRKTMTVSYDYTESYEYEDIECLDNYVRKRTLHTCTMTVTDMKDVDQNGERKFVSSGVFYSKKESKRGAIKMAVNSGIYSI